MLTLEKTVGRFVT